MKRNPWLAGFLSLLFPGLGQVYAGKRAIGAAFMLAFVIIGNLNAIWLSTHAGAPTDPTYIGNTLPRLLHDVFAAYSVIFWVWTAADAYRITRKDQPGRG